MGDQSDRIRELRSADKKLSEHGLLDSSGDGRYTPRERYRRVMHFQGVDHVPNYEFGYWDATLQGWHEQGLPDEVDDVWKAAVFFDFDPPGAVPIGGVPTDLGLRPGFEHTVLEETDRYRIVRDTDGIKSMVYKDGSSTIPHFIEFPLKKRGDWEDFKRRLDPADPARYAGDWEQIRESFEDRKTPFGMMTGSLFGWIRNWMGFEGISLACYDDPELVEEIIEHLTELILRVVSHSLQYAKPDTAFIWEDICFNHGPIISPAMFKRWLVPRYKRITDMLRKHSVYVIMVDCDGNINELVEHWLDGGVNCMFPLEIGSGSDPVKLRERFGQRVLLMGGVDKTQLTKGKKEIEKEMERIRKTVESGGFIPHVDHFVPPDVPYDNWLYYLKLKKQILGA